MKLEYEWVFENLNINPEEQLICRAYRDTQSKPLEGDILRCGEPDNLPDFRVNEENFEAVVKVC